MTKILILAALDGELCTLPDVENVNLVHTGVGKVNAAVSATLAILKHKPDIVINYGTAGKINPLFHGLVEVAQVIQRDMLAMPLSPRGITPLSNDPHAFFSGFGKATCGTGDSFVTQSDEWLTENGVDIVDMELFSIAHVCTRFNLAWRAFKFITDDANEASAHDWQNNITKGELLFWEQLANDLDLKAK